MSTSKTLTFDSPRLLDQLYCGDVQNLTRLEELLGLKITARDDWMQLEGPEKAIQDVEEMFKILKNSRGQGLEIKQGDFDKLFDSLQHGQIKDFKKMVENPVVVSLRRKTIVPKTLNQKRYLQAIFDKEIVFGVGPAGTGKTYLAMAAALSAFQNGEVEKIILTRPAVEAGEALGFLPGDLEEKILPYLRPLYDALYDMLGKEETAKMIERGGIEIAPLAYMRGRTLSKSFIILDEAQNTTTEQMMMFLTRLGEKGRIVITGDITQIDLPRNKKSGLRQALEVLKDIKGIELFFFDKTDVVRHHLVQKIIEAYEAYQAHWDAYGPRPT
jgi:phosphate starvation-inducible PhoH-like protein